MALVEAMHGVESARCATLYFPGKIIASRAVIFV
jgi:hypothetical protein